MKKIQSLLALAISLFVLSCSSNGSEYKTLSHTDKNGYAYETVQNDPTGLRLYTLENGLKVYLSQNNDEPKIQTYVAVRAGSNYDPKESTGLAHYLEHMLFKGTDKIGTSDWEKEKKLLEEISKLYEKHRIETDVALKEKIYRAIDSVSYEASKYAIANEYDKMVGSVGATGTNAYTWFEETVYRNKIPANELDKFLQLEKEKFSKLVLRLFHTELEAVYEEFNRSQDSDYRKAHYAMMNGLFPTHPYGQQTTIGTSEHLKNPSLKDIREYFNTYYVPNNMAVVLVGDLDFDKAIKSVDATFGKLESKEVTHPVLPKEDPITEVVKMEVYGPSNENVTVAFRTAGVNTEVEKLISLLEMVLMNGNAGLFDLHLNQKQLVQNSYTQPTFLNDYGFLQLSGTPKEGQSLDEVKDLMLSQIEKIKSGDFEEWILEAVINDLKLRDTRGTENSTQLGMMYYNAFIHHEEWEDKTRFLDDLREISKEELITFANKFFKNNYVVVYKRKGKDETIVKVKNPKITPAHINRGQSEYFDQFVNIPAEELKPVFVDYQKEIKKDVVNNGVEISYIKNVKNDLFNLNVIFDMGKDHDKKLTLAVGYLEYLGTDKYSAIELKEEFYKLGVNYSVNMGNDRSYVSISGLQENLGEGLELLEHLMANVVVDQQAYDEYVNGILKARSNTKTQKASILKGGLNSFIQYGENSRLRNIYSVDELKSMDPSELVEIVKGLNSFKHRVFYYGKDVDEAKSALNSFHKTPSEFKEYPLAKKYKQLETGKKVYFVDYDMVQAEMYFIAKGQEFDAKKMARASVFNSYFGSGLSSIVFQEIRESKSLAYAAASAYQVASEKGKDDLVLAYIGTQANKVPQAVDAMMELMNNMPEVELQFNSAKEAALKKIAAQRITKSGIFWNYESLLKRGIDYDIREEVYNEIKNMTLSDIVEFFENNVKGQDYSISVIGNKEDLDMKALEKLGEIHEMDVDYLFNHKPTAVKP